MTIVVYVYIYVYMYPTLIIINIIYKNVHPIVNFNSKT